MYISTSAQNKNFEVRALKINLILGYGFNNKTVTRGEVLWNKKIIWEFLRQKINIFKVQKIQFDEIQS